MKLAFVIIAHDNPGNAARLAKLLLETGADVCIHYDLKAGSRPVEEIGEALGDLASRLIWAKRVRVSWGEWSIVQATLNGVRAIFDSGAQPDYIHLMSASDYPIRPISEFVGFLERHKGTDFIESHAIERNTWVKGGLTKERYRYRHYFNFKKHPKLFNLCWRVQALLKLGKKVPSGLRMHMGSQWCTLTANSWRQVLERGSSREVQDFFRLSWIPDEMFVQTLLSASNTPHSNRHLTLYQFNDYGVPIVYYDSHLDYLSRQPFFFARKMSPHASKLRDGLDRLVNGELPVRRFRDDQIGTPTEEYETFRTLYRKGMKGVRIPGFVKDPWYGDLEWNTRPYVAIVGNSTEELDQIAAAIDRVPGLICHRYLFAPGRIGFAANRDRFAGYSKYDVVLRDNKATNFLVDVIGESPSLTTCFLVRTGEAAKLLDVMRWDENARLVFLEGGLLRGFLERISGLEVSSRGAEQPDGHGRTAMQYYTSYFDWQQTILKERKKILQNSKASFAWIDMLDPAWKKLLADILTDIGHEPSGFVSGAGAALAPRFNRRIDLPLSVQAAILDAASSRPEKERIAREMLAQPKSPYLVIIGASRSETLRLAQALQATSQFSFDATRSASLSAILLDLLDATHETRTRPKIVVFGIDETFKVDLFHTDPDARVIRVVGSPEHAALERLEAEAVLARGGGDQASGSLPLCDPVAFQQTLAGNALALGRARARAGFAECPTLEIDLSQSDWPASLALFLASTLDGSGEKHDELVKHLSRVKGGGQVYSSDAYRNAEYLRMIGEQQRLATTASTWDALGGNRFEVGQVKETFGERA